MMNDIHICGSCLEQFSDINEFVGHKTVCSVNTPSSVSTVAATNMQSSIQIARPTRTQQASVSFATSGHQTTCTSTSLLRPKLPTAPTNIVTAKSLLMPNDGKLFVQVVNNYQTEQQSKRQIRVPNDGRPCGNIGNSNQMEHLSKLPIPISCAQQSTEDSQVCYYSNTSQNVSIQKRSDPLSSSYYLILDKPIGKVGELRLASLQAPGSQVTRLVGSGLTLPENAQHTYIQSAVVSTNPLYTSVPSQMLASTQTSVFPQQMVLTNECQELVYKKNNDVNQTNDKVENQVILENFNPMVSTSSKTVMETAALNDHIYSEQHIPRPETLRLKENIYTSVETVEEYREFNQSDPIVQNRNRSSNLTIESCAPVGHSDDVTHHVIQDQSTSVQVPAGTQYYVNDTGISHMIVQQMDEAETQVSRDGAGVDSVSTVAPVVSNSVEITSTQASGNSGAGYDELQVIPGVSWDETSLLREQAEELLTTTPRKFQCPRCCRGFQYQKDLDRHFRTHTGDKPFACDQCDKRYSRKDKLRIHMRTHTGVKPYQCDKCGYRSTEASSLKAHMLIHVDLKPFSCQICSYAARTSNALTVHLRTHTGDSPFMCYVCQAAFKIKSDLNRHLRIHNGEKPYKCTMCDYACAIKSNLASHVKCHHDNERMMKCKWCDFSTSSSRRLNSHQLTHQDMGKPATTKAAMAVKAAFSVGVMKNVSTKTESIKTENDASTESVYAKASNTPPTVVTTPSITTSSTHACVSSNATLVTMVTRVSSRRDAAWMGGSVRQTSSRPQYLKCTLCAYRCTNKSALTKHKKIHVSEEEKEYHPAGPDKRPGKSAPVSRQTKRQNVKQPEASPRSRNSLALCEKRFKCTKCDAAFVRYNSLRCHLRNHTDTENFLAMSVLQLQKPFTLNSDEEQTFTDLASNSNRTVHVNDEAMSHASKDQAPNHLRDDDIELSGSNPDAADRNTAVLSRAASNLLAAFMENQHNSAMEDNMLNMARQRAMLSAVSSGASTNAVIVRNVDSIEGQWGTNSRTNGALGGGANGTVASGTGGGGDGILGNGTVGDLVGETVDVGIGTVTRGRSNAIGSCSGVTVRNNEKVSGDTGIESGLCHGAMGSVGVGAVDGLLSLAEQALDTDGDLLFDSHNSSPHPLQQNLTENIGTAQHITGQITANMDTALSVGDIHYSKPTNGTVQKGDSRRFGLVSSANIKAGESVTEFMTSSPIMTLLYYASNQHTATVQTRTVSCPPAAAVIPSSWEQLQQAVLNSVNVQSPTRTVSMVKDETDMKVEDETLHSAMAESDNSDSKDFQQAHSLEKIA